jgi:hypothetical protein
LEWNPAELAHGKMVKSMTFSESIARIIKNHIGYAILVWTRLKQVAEETRQTFCRVQHGLLSDYLRQQPKAPSVKMVLT